MFRGIPDYVELNEVVKEAESVAIIGGGFLGSELSCALARRGNFQFQISFKYISQCL